MSFLRAFVAGTLILLTFCSIMVVQQTTTNEAEHVELRESFLLLARKGHAENAMQLYQRLLLTLQDLPDKTLVADLQRAAMFVEPAETQTDNLIWRFYWSINNELEKRAEIRLGKLLTSSQSR